MAGWNSLTVRSTFAVATASPGAVVVTVSTPWRDWPAGSVPVTVTVQVSFVNVHVGSSSARLLADTGSDVDRATVPPQVAGASLMEGR